MASTTITFLEVAVTLLAAVAAPNSVVAAKEVASIVKPHQLVEATSRANEASLQDQQEAVVRHKQHRLLFEPITLKKLSFFIHDGMALTKHS